MGLALFYGLEFSGNLTFLLLWVSRLEAELNSVERLEAYCNGLPQEAIRHNANDPDIDSWPQRGQIEFEAINVSYPSNANEIVLKNVTFEIRGGEKVGLVGRTGSGKSTLALALFRILELQEGCIRIDGIDISKLGLDTLRKRLQIIPQDPILFSGTIQSNLDLECKYSDNDIWDVLEMVGLKDYVSQQDEKLGCVVEESGTNLSVGQRQLICLGRAILTKPKILVMDEATASIDNEADKMIQRSIRSHLQNTTILCIAHRLNTIADFDRVLVLNDGVVEEFDTPIALLGSNGIFSQLVNATGPANAQLIREIAKLTREQDKVLC
jgi:ABC-type multidrug transport system fused ATPase/permease subunit